jgi:hypothetical protein
MCVCDEKQGPKLTSSTYNLDGLGSTELSIHHLSSSARRLCLSLDNFKASMQLFLPLQVGIPQKHKLVECMKKNQSSHKSTGFFLLKGSTHEPF